MICFHEIIWALLLFECWWLCDFHVFMDIFLFYSLLEGFRTSFQVFHKTSFVFLHFGRVFNYAKIIFKLIFENSYLPKGVRIGDHVLYALIENLFNMCMKREVVWVIHLILIIFLIGITIDIFLFVYSYFCFLYMYASNFK